VTKFAGFVILGVVCMSFPGFRVWLFCCVGGFSVVSVVFVCCVFWVCWLLDLFVC